MMIARKFLSVLVIVVAPIAVFAQDVEQATEEALDTLDEMSARAWAASHDLEAEDWARKSVRITMVLYREQMLEAVKMMPEQMAQQLAMIEEQREQLGEEMYQQIKQGMEESAKYGKAIEENARSLPKPTAAEQAILDKYRAELMMLMESDEQDEEYYEDDEYDEY